MPGLSKNHAESAPQQFSNTLDWALRLVIVLASPAAVAMLVFAGPMTATIFGYGAFTERDVLMASYALMAYSWGLLAFSLVKVLAPGYFARQDTRTPVRVALIGLGCNMAINLFVVLPAYFAGFPIPHVLLATATCIGAAINSYLLWRGLKRAGVYSPLDGWPALLWRVLAANAAMAALLFWLGGSLESWTGAPPLVRALRLAGCIGAAAALYFAVLYLTGMRVQHVRSRA